MKNLLLITALFLTSQVLLAQEPDSVQNENKQVPQDTIPPVKEEASAEDQPRIIYYQSTDDEPRKEKRRRDDIKTLSGSMSHSGGFGALSFRSSEFRDESLVMAGLRGGWIINRTLGIGIEGHGIIPTTKFDDIDPNREVNLLGGYGGMFLELIFFSNEVVHVTFPVSGGAGWLGYQVLNENNTIPPSMRDDEVDSDVFWYIEPGGNLEFNISRNFRLDLGVSKRFTQDFELINTDADAFEKLNYYITLKIGGF
ncbi:MAG: hypothetical protein Tsb0034_15300 [Ekhidna sp.]